MDFIWLIGIFTLHISVLPSSIFSEGVRTEISLKDPHSGTNIHVVELNVILANTDKQPNQSKKKNAYMCRNISKWRRNTFSTMDRTLNHTKHSLSTYLTKMQHNASARSQISLIKSIETIDYCSNTLQGYFSQNFQTLIF